MRVDCSHLHDGKVNNGGHVEGGVKEAVELGKTAVKAGVVSGKIAQWWENVASGKTKGVTIKSSDGQDVTSLINRLVDTAVLRSSKDTTPFIPLRKRASHALWSSSGPSS